MSDFRPTFLFLFLYAIIVHWHIIFATLALVGAFLLFHITEVPCQRHAYASSAVAVYLVACEVSSAGEGLEAS